MTTRIEKMLIAALAAVVAVFVLYGTPAFPQTSPPRQACAERDKVIERLTEKYGETRQSMGFITSQAVMEVWANETKGTWTIIITNANGISCLLSAGMFWDGNPSPLPPSGDDV